MIGVVQAFEVLGKQDAALAASEAVQGMAPQEVMAAIAEALVATAVGLFVAIPAVAMYNIFQRKLKSILANTDALGSVLLAHLVAEAPKFGAPVKPRTPSERRRVEARSSGAVSEAIGINHGEHRLRR